MSKKKAKHHVPPPVPTGVTVFLAVIILFIVILGIKFSGGGRVVGQASNLLQGFDNPSQDPGYPNPTPGCIGTLVDCVVREDDKIEIAADLGLLVDHSDVQADENNPSTPYNLISKHCQDQCEELEHKSACLIACEKRLKEKAANCQVPCVFGTDDTHPLNCYYYADSDNQVFGDECPPGALLPDRPRDRERIVGPFIGPD